MSTTEQLYGLVVLATFGLFSIVLAWQSWSYARSKTNVRTAIRETGARNAGAAQASEFGHAAH